MEDRNHFINIIKRVWSGKDSSALDDLRKIVSESTDFNVDGIDCVKKQNNNVIIDILDLSAYLDFDEDEIEEVTAKLIINIVSGKITKHCEYQWGTEDIKYPKTNEKICENIKLDEATWVEYELRENNAQKIGKIKRVIGDIIIIDVCDSFHKTQADRQFGNEDYGYQYEIGIPALCCKAGSIEDYNLTNNKGASMEEDYLYSKGAWIGYPCKKTNIYTVGEHTKKVVDYCIAHGGSENLIKAAWLHDISKINDSINGRHDHYAKYCEKSAEIACAIGESEYVVELIRHHNPGEFFEDMDEYIRLGKEWCRELVLLIKADIFALNPVGEIDVENPINECPNLLFTKKLLRAIDE